jgi:hypothetical protein
MLNLSKAQQPTIVCVLCRFPVGLLSTYGTRRKWHLIDPGSSTLGFWFVSSIDDDVPLSEFSRSSFQTCRVPDTQRMHRMEPKVNWGSTAPSGSHQSFPRPSTQMPMGMPCDTCTGSVSRDSATARKPAQWRARKRQTFPVRSDLPQHVGLAM